MDNFDQPEILDDLVDGWVADVHSGKHGAAWLDRFMSPVGFWECWLDARIILLCHACPPIAEERLQFIHLLQHFASSKHLRVSILSGAHRPARLICRSTQIVISACCNAMPAAHGLHQLVAVPCLLL